MYLVISFRLSIGEYDYGYRGILLESLCMHNIKSLVASRKQHTKLQISYWLIYEKEISLGHKLISCRIVKITHI